MRHEFDIVSGSCFLIQRNALIHCAYVLIILVTSVMSVIPDISDMSYFVERIIKECSDFLRIVCIRGGDMLCLIHRI